MAGHYAASFVVPVSLYCASKCAVTGMEHSLRNEINAANLKIKVTVIFCATFIDTNFHRSIAIEGKRLTYVYRTDSSTYVAS